MTQVNKIPPDWGVYDFVKTLSKQKVGRSHQINASEIQSDGHYPVVDQGQDYIAGYSDNANKVFSPSQPLIVFGDHTRCLKYVDFPFIIGADGTKILFPETKLFNPKFYYFYLLSLRIPSRGYNRHFKLLKEQKVLCPPAEEQANIAHILSKIQSAIETQDKIIQTTTELKKALMQKFFTEGIDNSDFKETELGNIPKSWQVVKAEDFCGRVTDGTHDTPKRSKEGHYLITSKNLKGRYIDFKDSYFISQGDYDLVNQRSKVDLFDVLFGMIGTIGSPILIRTEPDFAIKNVGLFKTGKDEEKGLWLYHYLCSPVVQELISKQSKGAIQKYVPLWWLRSLPILLPPEKERLEIIRSLETIDNKLENAETKKSTLELLFKSMLHHLMIGQIRVKDIRFS